MQTLDLHLGRPIHRGPLTIFPIWNADAVNIRGYDLKAHHLAIDELPDGPSVPQLLVTNAGARPVLVLEGELLEGGHQHRVAAETIVVPAGQRSPISVRCVEQGRWHGGHQHQRDGRRAPVKVRALAARGQAEAWHAVAEYQEKYRANETVSLLHAIDDVEQDASRLVAGLRPLPFQSGVMIGLAGQPLLLEVFDSPRTLAHAWDALLRSAAVDAAGMPAVATPGRRARRFLDRLRQVPVQGRGPAGAGEAAIGESQYARLSFTAWDGRVVHAVAVNPRHELVLA
ncbi:MAG TPA: DUF6569 family protein [Mycobacteriales bacterium]|nr:DUF6569 family protein [Mycobacteriales bacterium]